jgi:hypothetical protein
MLIHNGGTIHHHAVHGGEMSGRQHKDVSKQELLERDRALIAITQNPHPGW